MREAQQEHGTDIELTMETAAQKVEALLAGIKRSIFGQDQLIHDAVCCLLSGGHILITGAPGLAKTSLVRVLGRSLGLACGRIQFTPDLLPSDIIGSEILDVDPLSEKRSFRFAKGPIFNNLLLADEINRASPRTQSALLEAMQEGTCTVGHEVHKLPDPFMVFATQNPFEFEGTFPLPEAQMDRFLAHCLVSYPAGDAEEKILNEHVHGRLVGEQKSAFPAEPSESIISGAQLRQLILRARDIRIEEELVRAIMDLVRSTRPELDSCPPDFRGAIWYGAGPRAGISLVSMSRAAALVARSECVRWHHVKQMARPVLRHRIRLSAKAYGSALTEDVMIQRLLEQLETKYGNLAKGLS